MLFTETTINRTAAIITPREALKHENNKITLVIRYDIIFIYPMGVTRITRFQLTSYQDDTVEQQVPCNDE